MFYFMFFIRRNKNNIAAFEWLFPLPSPVGPLLSLVLRRWPVASAEVVVQIQQVPQPVLHGTAILFLVAQVHRIQLVLGEYPLRALAVHVGIIRRAQERLGVPSDRPAVHLVLAVHVRA